MLKTNQFSSIFPVISGFLPRAHSYGFQGQEEDNELWAGGVSFKYRVEDARLGRFFSVDPLVSDYAYNSPYSVSENRLIDGIELEGLEFKIIQYPKASGIMIDVVREKDLELGVIQTSVFKKGAINEESKWPVAGQETITRTSLRPVIGEATVNVGTVISQGDNIDHVAAIEVQIQSNIEKTNGIFNDIVEFTDTNVEVSGEKFLVSGSVDYKTRVSNSKAVISTVGILTTDPDSEGTKLAVKHFENKYKVTPTVLKSEENAIHVYYSISSDTEIMKRDFEFTKVEHPKSGQIVTK